MKKALKIWKSSQKSNKMDIAGIVLGAVGIIETIIVLIAVGMTYYSGRPQMVGLPDVF